MSLDTRLFSYDPATKIKRLFHGQDDGSFVIETIADVTDAVELNKAQYNNVDERARWDENELIARIPLTVLYDLKRKGILEDEQRLKDWLNDSDNRFFRTRPGRV